MQRIAKLSIADGEYDNALCVVRITLPSLSFLKAYEAVAAIKGAYQYDGSRAPDEPEFGYAEDSWVLFEMDDGIWVQIGRNGDGCNVEVCCYRTWDDPTDALDGTKPPPSEMSLSDRLAVAAIIKKIIAE